MRSVELSAEIATIPQPVRRRNEEAEGDEHGGRVATSQLEHERRQVRGSRPRSQLEEAAEWGDVRKHPHCNAVRDIALSMHL